MEVIERMTIIVRDFAQVAMISTTDRLLLNIPAQPNSPNFVRRKVNDPLANGFVKMSAVCSLVGT